MARSKRGKHTSARGVFQRTITWLEGLDGVKKVQLSCHKPCRHSLAPGRLIIVENTTTGIKLRGYTDVGIMRVFLILSSPNEDRIAIKQAIERKFPIN